LNEDIAEAKAGRLFFVKDRNKYRKENKFLQTKLGPLLECKETILLTKKEMIEAKDRLKELE